MIENLAALYHLFSLLFSVLWFSAMLHAFWNIWKTVHDCNWKWDIIISHQANILIDITHQVLLVDVICLHSRWNVIIIDKSRYKTYLISY